MSSSSGSGKKKNAEKLLLLPRYGKGSIPDRLQYSKILDMCRADIKLQRQMDAIYKVVGLLGKLSPTVIKVLDWRAVDAWEFMKRMKRHE